MRHRIAVVAATILVVLTGVPLLRPREGTPFLQAYY